MLLLRDRRRAFEEAGVTPYGVSRDSPWSHVAWAQALDLGGVRLLSDWNAEAVRGLGIGFRYRGLEEVARRSAFLVSGDGMIRGAWRYESSEVPDFDALLSAARSPS
ncbi:MAG: redoxin domain-containing protein [Gaiellaceae bacterium]